MRRVVVILACCFLLSTATRADDPIFPDGTPASQLGGLMIIRQGNQTTVSVGGVLFPRRVKTTTATPEGPVVTRIVLPSAFQSPVRPPLPESAPGFLQVEIPDDDGLVYIEGELIHTTGTSRRYQSPPLPPGAPCILHLRAAFKVGDNLLIEDKQVAIQAGENSVVQFDGIKAVSVPLPRGDAEPLPFPRTKKG
jgi:hypothetical protein